jgi:hypothetical protein
MACYRDSFTFLPFSGLAILNVAKEEEEEWARRQDVEWEDTEIQTRGYNE